MNTADAESNIQTLHKMGPAVKWSIDTAVKLIESLRRENKQLSRHLAKALAENRDLRRSLK